MDRFVQILDMFRGRPISENELSEIRKSVDKAYLNLMLELTPARDFRKLLRQETGLSKSEKRRARILFSLRFMEKRDLRTKPILAAILDAVKANDLQFFVTFGQVLAHDPTTADDYQIMESRSLPFTKLEEFLLSHWASRHEDVPELFYLTPEGLAEVCNFYLRTEHITSDAVVKLRQRLGLKPFKRGKIHVIRDGKTLRFTQLDKKTR